MAWVLVGLGNPGAEYTNTRHNAGRLALEHACVAFGFGAPKEMPKAKLHVARGTLEKSIVVIVLPNTFMNKSGAAVLPYVKSVKQAEHMIVVHDDLDLPLGRLKVSFDRGSGGHKGIESIARAVKTTKFVRIRVGVSPSTAAGQTKKPLGESAVEKFLLSDFSSNEMKELEAQFSRINEAIKAIVTHGATIAMNEFNRG